MTVDRVGLVLAIKINHRHRYLAVAKVWQSASRRQGANKLVVVRVGVYVDGFNLYYGGVGLAGGHGVPGWRWIDLRKLATNIVTHHPGWPNATVERVVYCTARIKGVGHPQPQRDQDTYLRALIAADAVDHIEYGYYAVRVVSAPLATRGLRGRPVLVESDWPVRVKDGNDQDVPQARFMVSVARREEKGTDVNVGTHLLVDALSGVIDAALVITNDSDLALPVRRVREIMPVGVINPTVGQTSGSLKLAQGVSVGQHWGRALTFADLAGAQLPAQVGRLTRPAGW